MVNRSAYHQVDNQRGAHLLRQLSACYRPPHYLTAKPDRLPNIIIGCHPDLFKMKAIRLHLRCSGTVLAGQEGQEGQEQHHQLKQVIGEVTRVNILQRQPACLKCVSEQLPAARPAPVNGVLAYTRCSGNSCEIEPGPAGMAIDINRRVINAVLDIWVPGTPSIHDVG